MLFDVLEILEFILVVFTVYFDFAYLYRMKWIILNCLSPSP
jgi:hypothetical protein